MANKASCLVLGVVVLLTVSCSRTGADQDSSPNATTDSNGQDTVLVKEDMKDGHRSPPEQTMPATAPVPDEYQALYASLAESLESFHDYLDAHWDGTRASTAFGAELGPANGNRGEKLLQSTTMSGVSLYLDRLEELGVQGVTVQISYPLLGADFPRSDEYLQFYREVAQEVRRRGLKLLVETGPVFPDPEYSNVQADFSSLTIETYFQTKKEQILLIAGEVQPDYLSIGNEPATERMLTGLSFSLDEYLTFIRETSDGIDRSSGVLVGAGTGIWEDPAYLTRFADEPSLDFVNIHIYPVRGGIDYLQQVVEVAVYARTRGKELVIGEAWLYKASPLEVTQNEPYQNVFPRDVYSFWEPLDARFIEAIMGIAHYQNFEYVSFFWSKYFFSYLDYDETPRDLSRAELIVRSNQAAFSNVRAGVFTGTGQAYQRLLDEDSCPGD